MTDLAGRKVAYYAFTGMIDQHGVTRVGAALNKAVNEGCDEAYFCLNSIGGYVGDGIFLYNYMRGLPLKVTAHNIGGMSSIAVAVFLGAEDRFCSAHSMFMIHPTTLGPFDAIAWERLDSARSAALADDTRTENILRERANIPDEVLSARRVRDVHITPDEALKWGLVQSVREFALPKGNEILQV